MRKFLAMLLAVVMVLSLMAPIAMAEGEDHSGDIAVLYTNDVHTYIDGALSYDNIAALKTDLEDEYKDVILVDAGDHIQGTAYGSMDKGKTIIDLMNAAGYDLATLGNHEFDYAMEGRINVTDNWAEYPYVSCNFYHMENGVAGENVLDSYKVFDIEGTKVAFIGITTPETYTKSTPAYFQDENGNYIYGIAGGTDGAALYAAVQAAIDAASAEADVVIALGHLGDDPASQPWTSEEVIANTTGLDAFIDGHSHSTVEYKEVADKEGNTVVLTQTGEYFGKIGKMTIAADGTVTTEFVTEYTGSDAEVKAIKDAWLTEIDTQLGQVIGTAEVSLENYDASGRLVRKQETNAGDFCADALYYLFDDMGLDVDLAIMNGGGIRNKAGITGDLTYKTMKEIHTFGNVACLQTVTGQQILDALEWGARGTPNEEIGGFLHVAGLTYEINSAVESTVQMDENGVWVGGPTGAYRVNNVKVFNKETNAYEALDLNAKYNMAGYNYTLRDLGDGFAMFDGAVNVLDYVMEDYMVLANYVQGFENANVQATNSPLKAQYSNMLVDYSTVSGSGRITIGEQEASGEAVILYTNDVHTYIDGAISYDNIAALKDQLKYEVGNVLLVDAGDHIQGTAYGSMDKGKTIIDLMNAAGYDLATLGNHEFDYAMEGRINVTDNWAEYPYVSSNFYYEESGETVLDSYKVFDLGGKKVALIGITTPESFTKSTPAYFQDENGNYIYGISGGTDGAALYAAVQAAIDAASAEADIVIALGHLGDDESSKPWTSEEVIANTTGLAAFIDGHSHSTVEYKEVADKDGNTVVLTQTGEYFNAIGKMTIAADGTITTELVTEVTGSDAEVKAIKDAWIAEIDTQLGQKIGTAEVTLDNYDAEGNRLVRIQETNTGDFAADALYYLFDNMGLDVDFAIMNGGGVRNAAVTGDLTYKTMKEIHTFGNVACLQTITGQQLLDALEWGARQAPAVQVGGFLHVAGLTYEIDASVESTVQNDENGVWTGGPTGEYRVKNVMVYNKETNAYEALDLNKEYNLAGYNYTLRDLGDGFAMFDGAVNVLDYVMEDYMVLANYVQAFENATVKAANSPLLDKYPNMKLDYGTTDGSGRITIGNVVEEEWDGKIIIGGLDNNIWMTKYGNVYTNCEAKNFVDALELTWGDLVTVKFLDQELVLPVVPTYSYVDSGKPAIILEKTATGSATGYVSLAINMGNFAETYGIAVKGTDEAGNWFWTGCEGVEFPIEVTFELYEKEGYMAEYILHELTRTNDREDYEHLDDEEFANFRVVDTTGMGEDTLYRSSSPINPEIGRNEYADAAIKNAGVTVIMNLADSAEEAAQYEGFADTYYAGQKVIYLCLGVDFAADDFKDGLAEGLKFFAENEGTYLVHCTEGKDRAGFVTALLECLMGATYDEVVEDYMVTYYNYYGVEAGTEKYEAIANSNIIKSLEKAFGVEDLSKADLAAEAKEYILSLGLTEDEVTNLMVNLGLEVTEEPEDTKPEDTKPEDTKPEGGDGPAETGDPIVIWAGMAIFSLCGACVMGKKKEEF